MMIDDGSVFLSQKQNREITFLSVQQKQGQNGSVRLGILRCSAEHNVIILVTRFVVCFGSVVCTSIMAFLKATDNCMIWHQFPGTDDPCADFSESCAFNSILVIGKVLTADKMQGSHYKKKVWLESLEERLEIMVLETYIALPPPTSQTLFTFILFPSSSILLQTPKRSEYHPLAQVK